MLAFFFRRDRYRLLRDGEMGLLFEHLLRMPENDLRRRFHCPMSAEALFEHIRDPGARREVIGWFHHGTLRGAVEVFLGGARAEAGVSVEPAWQGKGVGTELIRRAVKLATRRRAKTLAVLSSRGNGAMIQIAAKLYARISRQKMQLLERLDVTPSLPEWLLFDLEETR